VVEKAKLSNAFKDIFKSKQTNSHTTGYYHQIIKMLKIKHRLNILLNCGLNIGRAEKQEKSRIFNSGLTNMFF